MVKAKQLLVTAVVALSTLLVAATPRTAAAEPAAQAEAVAFLPDGWYLLYNSSGKVVGSMVVEGGQIVAIYSTTDI